MPVVAAAKGCGVDVVRQMLEAGADVDARDARGQTALTAAAAGRHDEIAEILERAEPQS